MAKLPILAPESSSAPVSALVPRKRPGPLEEALRALWESTSPKLSRPLHLWTWFTLQRKHHLHFLRRSQMKIEVPVGLLPDCKNCLEVCCTGPQSEVTLRLRDIAVLIDGGLSQHIQRRKADKSSPVPKSRSGRMAQASVFYEFFPSLTRDATGTCTLLGPELLCTAYPNWPLSCARYPYSLDLENNVIFLAKGCQSHRKIQIDDAPDAIRKLVRSAIDGYNERIKDIILLHLAGLELEQMGLLQFLSINETFLKKYVWQDRNKRRS